MSSGSKARLPSDRNVSWGGGVARSTEEAGQCPQREGAAQGNTLDEGNTAAPAAESTVSTKLAGLVARARKEARLTNVMQFVDEELLRLAFRSLRKAAAPGVDGQRYEDYAAQLDEHLGELYDRLKTGRYRAPAVRRVYIPKANGGQRPLGITTVEDRVVQKAVAWVLEAVYEQDFLDCSHGFRPARSPHTALHRLREGMMQHAVRAVVEVDLVGYFDHVDHGWLRRFVRHRVNDGGLLRLLGKWLKAGVMENGVVTRGTDGVPQGGPVSPVLSNIYLHYVLDQWFERRFKRQCGGWAELTRYADDFVAVFVDREDAEQFRVAVEERLGRFGLQVAPTKTVVRRFDRTLVNGSGRARQRPETFTFLGFTHFLTRTRWGGWNVGRTPSVRSRERFLHRIAAWVKANRHQPVREQQAYLRRALSGYYQYFGLRLCLGRLAGVRQRVRWLWKRALGRRSQRARRRTDWATLQAVPWFQLPQPRLTHTWV
jgi:group II intron reverse transcriptase/maturase